MFGGNSNWLGPVWMPVNALIVRALVNLYAFHGDDFKVECQTGSGQRMSLFEVAQEIFRRLTGTFLRDANGQRPVYGRTFRFQDDPHWRPDPVLRVFPATTARVLGPATRPAGRVWSPPFWTLFARVDATSLAESERGQVLTRVIREQVGGDPAGTS